MSRQIASQQRSGATPNLGSWSPLRSINLSANQTYMCQLFQGTTGSKETEVQRRLRLQANIHQLEEDKVIKEEDVFVPEMPPTPTMALMDIDVARYRVAVLLNNANNFLLPILLGRLCHTPNLLKQMLM
jgi:acyl-CoA synthetase (AMP-forming)/AMP-acid ligase II